MKLGAKTGLDDSPGIEDSNLTSSRLPTLTQPVLAARYLPQAGDWTCFWGKFYGSWEKT